MTSRDHERSNSWRLERNISKTVGDRDSVPKDYQQEMAYGVSNGYVINDVTWLHKVKHVTQICLERNISKTAGDAI